MTLTIAFKTDIGRVREVNEDSYAVLGSRQLDDKLDSLIVVADGMGGGRSGDIASGIVAQTLPETVHEVIYDRSAGVIDPNYLLRDTIMRANSRVWMRAVERKELRGMGTTCVAAIVKDDKLFVGNVGDSRAYLLRDGQLRQITEDHSEVWQQVKAGNMTREQASKSRYRNSITRAIGLTADVEPDMYTIPLQEGDTVLLCTDGLTTEVNDKEIARLLATSAEAEEACERLVASALRHGGSDNVTVVVARYGEFTPLVLPDAPPDEEEEDETPTDPDQEWRNRRQEEEAVADAKLAEPKPEKRPAPARSTHRNGKPTPRSTQRSEPRFTPPPGFDQEDEEERQARGGGGFALTLTLVLLAIIIALGGALVIALSNRKVTVIADTATPGVILKSPTEQGRDYPIATLMLKDKKGKAIPVADGPLKLVDTNGDIDVYVVSAKDGKLLKVDPLSNVTTIQSIAPLSTAKSPSDTTGDFTFDASEYRWQINPVEKCIDKYAGNTRVKQVGKGVLHGPTSIAIDNNATLYVIDKHSLYRMDAVMTGEEWNRMHMKKTDLDPASP